MLVWEDGGGRGDRTEQKSTLGAGNSKISRPVPSVSTFDLLQ